MMKLKEPLRFEPMLRPAPWGGRALAAILGKPLPSEGAFGESWEVSDHPLHRSRLITSGVRGKSIRELMEAPVLRERLLGRTAAARLSAFPWLFKFLDVRDWLSVQVHPDEQTAPTLCPGEGPKSEAWFVLDAQPGSRVFAGLKPGVGPQELWEALGEGSVVKCLHRFEPRAGDCLYLPAGTVHALGGGVLFAEIQQTSDATFRLFDWNRVDANGKPRELHVEKALAAIHWDQGPVSPVHVTGFSLSSEERQPVQQELVRSPYFHLDFVRLTKDFQLSGDSRLKALVAFAGRARLDNGAEILPGQVWLFPADLSECCIRPLPVLSGMLCALPVSD